MAMVIPLGHSDSIIKLPESAHSQFQLSKDGAYDFLVFASMKRDSTIWIGNKEIADPESPALCDELLGQFRGKAKRIKSMKVTFLKKSYFKYAGFIGKSKKLFLKIDSHAKWGKVVSLLRTVREAGVRDACFLTEEPFDPR